MKKVGYILIIILILAAIGGGIWQYRKFVLGKTTREIDEVMKAVANLMMLPDEIPTIATVTDETKLTDQNFFKNAKNGDKILIYKLAAKAIIYRPSINKIVEVTAILPNDQNNPASANAELVQVSTEVVDTQEATNNQVEIGLYNGTTTVGLTNKLEKKILDKFPQLNIKLKEKAINTDYQRTIVIDLNGKYKEKAVELADFLEAKVVNLPQGEVSPEADILIIVGKDVI